MVSQTFKVTLNVFFESGLDNWNFQNKEEYPDDINEPDLTDDEIDMFMTNTSACFNNSDIPRYIVYTENIINSLSLLSEKDIHQTNNNISYKDCKITFTFETQSSQSLHCDDVKNHILRDSFEDGMMEGDLDNEILVSTKNKYRVKKYNCDTNKEEYDLSYLELGHIECRNSRCITVESIN